MLVFEALNSHSLALLGFLASAFAAFSAGLIIPFCNLFCFDFVSPHAVLSQDQLVSQFISPDRLVCVAMFFHV